MTGSSTGVLVLVGLVALLVGAVLTAGEAAVLRLSRAALAEMTDSTLPSAGRVRRLMGDPHAAATSAALVAALCEVVTIVCLTLAVVSTGLGWWQSLVVSVLVDGFAALLLLRYWPRRLGRRYASGTLLVASGLLVPVHAVVTPLRRLRSAASDQDDLTDDEIRDMVDRVSESEHIEDDEREMFRSVLELGDTITREVMVPRTEMVTLPMGSPVRKALSLFLRSGFSRVPVVGESVDDVVGVLYLKDVVRLRHTVEDSADDPVDPLLRVPVFVPESKPVDDLLRDMQHGAFHMAMVVDEFGGIAGLVTMEDALEEIVGELTDEHDRSGPEVEDLGDGAYRVPSRMPVDELGELFALELDDDDVDSVGGLLAKALGKVPLPGSSARTGGLELTADRVEGRRKRIATVIARLATEQQDPAAGPAQGTSNQGAHR
ncbi:MAG TPA: hemolysin family protein [Actinotalea sp.]